MKPFDPRLVTEVAPARRPVALLAVLSCLDGAVSIAAAITGARLVWAVVSAPTEVGSALVWFLAVCLAKAVVTGATEWQASAAAVRVGQLLRRRALRWWAESRVEELPDAEDRAARATLGTASVEPYVARYLPALISAVVVPGLALITLVVIDWVSALIVVLTVPLLPIFAALIGQHTRDETSRKWRATAQLSAHFSDVMRGLPTLVNYQRAEHQSGLIGQVGERLRRATVQTLRTAFLSSAALELLTTVSVAIVAVCVGLRLTHGHLGLAAGLIAILVAPEAYWPIRRVGQEFHSAADGVQAIDRLLPPPTTTSEVNAPTANATWLNRVSYTHPGMTVPTVSELSLIEVPGLQVITGPSGAGKTTVAELLAGLRTPTSGTVQPRPVMLVAQQPVLIPGTLNDNLGDPDAIQLLAAKSPTLAGLLAELVTALPDGFQTVIGDDGVGLSAGQRHLVAICRAVICQSGAGGEALLVDEPTAHLDHDHTELVISALVELAAHQPVVAITHDPRLMAAATAEVTVPLIRAEPLQTGPVPTGPVPTEPVPTEPVPTEPVPTEPVSRERAALEAGADPEPASPPRTRSLLPAMTLGTLANCCGVALTAASGWLIVKASTQPVILTLLTAVVSVRAFGLFRPVLRHRERLSSHDVALARLAERRREVFAALVPLTPAALGRRRRGELLAAAARDVDDEIDALPRGRVPLVAIGVTSLVAVLGAGLVLPAAGLALLVAVLVLSLVLAVVHRGEASRHRAVLQARASVESIARLVAEWGPVARVSGVEARLGDQLGAAEAGQRQAAARLAGLRSAAMAAVHVWVGLTTVAIAALVAQALAEQMLSAPVAATVVLGPLAMTQLLTGVPDALSSLTRGRAARGRVHTLLTQPVPVSDPEQPEPFCPRDASAELRAVSASWTGDRPHLRDCSLQIGSGSTVGLIGANGSGKSTALAVLARQLAPLSGAVVHGSQDAAECTLDEVRRRLAITDDETHIFAASLRANLLLARPEADDAAAREALTAAGLGELLASLPDGLDTELGIGGRGLSGGERARLGLARALLSRRPVMLLDEPVAHLDHPTARRVLTDLVTASGDRTVVLVSHQDSGLEQCQVVLSLSPKAGVAGRLAQRPPIGSRQWEGASCR